MIDFLAGIFGHVYHVRLVSCDGKFRHNSFYLGSAWRASKHGVELAKEKTKDEGKEWALDRVTRI